MGIFYDRFLVVLDRILPPNLIFFFLPLEKPLSYRKTTYKPKSLYEETQPKFEDYMQPSFGPAGPVIPLRPTYKPEPLYRSETKLFKTKYVPHAN